MGTDKKKLFLIREIRVIRGSNFSSSRSFAFFGASRLSSKCRAVRNTVRQAHGGPVRQAHGRPFDRLTAGRSTDSRQAVRRAHGRGEGASKSGGGRKVRFPLGWTGSGPATVNPQFLEAPRTSDLHYHALPCDSLVKPVFLGHHHARNALINAHRKSPGSGERHLDRRRVGRAYRPYRHYRPHPTLRTVTRGNAPAGRRA